MASLKYRCLTGDARSYEYPVAASQYFYHNGESFVYLDSSGHVTKAATATTTLLGWAIVPTGQGAGTSDNYWKSSATAGADKIAVIVDPEALFLCPADAATTAGDAGNACDLVTVNDGTQGLVDVGTSSTDVLVIVKAGTYVEGGASTDVVVKLNPTKRQSDT